MARFVLILFSILSCFNLTSQNLPFQFDVNEHKLYGSDRSNNLIVGNGTFPDDLDLDVCFVNINFQNAKSSTRNDSLIGLYNEFIKNISTEFLSYKSCCFLDLFVESDSTSYTRRYSHFEIEYSPFCENPAAYNQPELMRIIKFNGNKFKYAGLHNSTFPFSIILSFRTNSVISDLITNLVRLKLLYGSKFLIGVGDIDDSVSHLNIKSVEDLELILDFLNRHYSKSPEIVVNEGSKRVWDLSGSYISMGQTYFQVNSFASFPTYYERSNMSQYVVGLDVPIFKNKAFNIGVSYNKSSDFESKPIASYTIIDEHENRSNYLGLKSSFNYSELGILIGVPLVSKGFHDNAFNFVTNVQLASYLLRKGAVSIFASENNQVFSNGVVKDNGMLSYTSPVKWIGFNSSSSFQVSAGCSYKMKDVPVNISMSIGRLYYAWETLSYSSDDVLTKLFLDKIIHSNNLKGTNIGFTLTYSVL